MGFLKYIHVKPSSMIYIDMKITCKECNQQFRQLTQKHFIKCTGSVNTVKEYKEKYPDAPLRAPDVSAKVAAANTIYKSGDNNPMKNPVHLEKMKRKQKEVFESDEYKRMKSVSSLNNNIYKNLGNYTLTGQENPNTGRKLPKQQVDKSMSTKRKLGYFNHNLGFHPQFNREACEIIENYGNEHGYNFRHALNHKDGEYYIKELGYWVDGYDEEKNVVIEYDERGHFDKSGNLKKRDIERQKHIIRLLGCKFIRISKSNSGFLEINISEIRMV